MILARLTPSRTQSGSIATWSLPCLLLHVQASSHWHTKKLACMFSSVHCPSISIPRLMLANPSRTRGSIIQSDENGFLYMVVNLTTGALLSNSPQLLLSLCYLIYNNLFTRLLMAREWAVFSRQYHPLRVTDPKVCWSARLPPMTCTKS